MDFKKLNCSYHTLTILSQSATCQFFNSTAKMSTPTPVPTSIQRTRPSNAGKHLGLPGAPKKRRTPAEKRADDQLLANSHAAKEAAIQQAIQQVGDLKNKMASDQVAATAPMKPVHPKPRQYHGKGNTGKGKYNPHYKEYRYLLRTHTPGASMPKDITPQAEPTGEPVGQSTDTEVAATTHCCVKPTSQCLRECIDKVHELKEGKQGDLDSARASEKMNNSEVQEMFVHTLPSLCCY